MFAKIIRIEKLYPVGWLYPIKTTWTPAWKPHELPLKTHMKGPLKLHEMSLKPHEIPLNHFFPLVFLWISQEKRQISPCFTAQNVVFTDGSTCGVRRLSGSSGSSASRRLQTTGTVTYVGGAQPVGRWLYESDGGWWLMGYLYLVGDWNMTIWYDYIYIYMVM